MALTIFGSVRIGEASVPGPTDSSSPHWQRLGPRFLAGDWNFEPHQLAIWSRLEAAGWIEVQDLLHSIDGTRPQPT